MSDVLAHIVARTRADLDMRRIEVPYARVEALAHKNVRRPHAFVAALGSQPGPAGVHLLAEFKPRSPSRGEIRPGARVDVVVPVYSTGASAISVLCDVPFFGGGFDRLAAARALTDKPILCKDFIVDEYQLLEARAAGADAALLMASVLGDALLARLAEFARGLGMDVLVEAHTDAELDRVLALGMPVVGVNSRDLHTLAIDLDAMFKRLERVPVDRIRVAESGFDSPEAVARARGAVDVILMGTELMRAPDIEARMRELGF